MMSSICLAKTAVSFGVAASARRTQPANGAAAVPDSNRRLVISVIASSPLDSRQAEYAVYRPYTAIGRRAPGAAGRPIAYDENSRHPERSRAQRGVAEGPFFNCHRPHGRRKVPRLRFAPPGMTGNLLHMR